MTEKWYLTEGRYFLFKNNLFVKQKQYSVVHSIHIKFIIIRLYFYSTLRRNLYYTSLSIFSVALVTINRIFFIFGHSVRTAERIISCDNCYVTFVSVPTHDTSCPTINDISQLYQHLF